MRYDFYAWIHKWQQEKNQGRILKEIIPPSNFKVTKREEEIKKKVKKSKLNEETKSQFRYYKVKELTSHRMFFQSRGDKFAEDVRTAYKWYILSASNTFSEIDNIFNSQSFLETFNIRKKPDTLKNLPKYATFIKINFKLKKPFLSKDDDEFYIIDNPIVKDKVFKLPMVRPSTWKGALRFAAIKVFEENISKDNKNWKNERLKFFRLFGHEKGIDEKVENYLDKIVASKINEPEKEVREEFKKFVKEKLKDIHFKGRLFFYPTFFNVISLDVITPLSRKTKTPVHGPIYLEIVPEKIKTKNGEEKVKGEFRLLYYPYDLIVRGEFDRIEDEFMEDIKFLAKALRKMFYEIGFSAKKTSGYGVIEKIGGRDIHPYGFKEENVEGILTDILQSKQDC